METRTHDEATVAAMREALEAALQSHVNLGKARRCDCSLCVQIRQALEPGAGRGFADRLREECAQVADWKASQVDTRQSPEAQKAAREIADRIRILKGRQF